MGESANLERQFSDRNRDLSGVKRKLQKLSKKKSLTPQEQKKISELRKEKVRLEAQIDNIQVQIETRRPLIGIGMYPE